MRRVAWRGTAGTLAALSLCLLALPFARGADLVRVLLHLAAYLGLAALASFGLLLLPGRTARAGEALSSLGGRADRWLTPERSGALLVLGIGLYTIFWSACSILRHQGLNSSGFDLAIQHQIVWNLAHGRGFESSIEVAHYLGDHVALTLPLFAPLLWIWDDVRILLAAQSLVLALGAWPVYRLARRRCGGRLEGILWAAAYLLTPAVGFMNKYDFHDLVVALPLLLAAIDAIDRGRLRVASLWMLLAVLTREEVGLAVAGLAVWAAIARRRALWGAVWCVLALGWASVALYVVIPHFRGGIGSDTLARYAWLGSNPVEIVETLVTRPWALFASHYHRVRRLVFPIQLLWPMAGLPILGIGRLAVALPNLGLSMTSSAISQVSIYFQYNAPILPALFWAGIEGHRRLLERGSSRGFLLVGIVISLLAANLADPAAWKDVPRPYTIVEGIRPRPNRAAFLEAAGRIPRDADLIASNDLAPHLSARRRLSILHVDRPNPGASWVAVDLTDTRHIESPRAVAETIARWVGSGIYRVDFLRDGILLLRRDGEGDEKAQAALRAYLAAWDLRI